MTNPADYSREESISGRDTLYIAVFGALWGLLEITLGTTLKGLRIPFTGLLMASLASMIFMSGRYLVRQRGAILMMGGVAALLKLFSIGGFMLGPFWAILFEALLGEAVFCILGVNRISVVMAGILILVYTTVHPFITQGILYGANIYRIYLDMLEKFANVLHISEMNFLLVGVLYLITISILGTIAGLTGYSIGREVDKKLQTYRQRGTDHA